MITIALHALTLPLSLTTTSLLGRRLRQGVPAGDAERSSRLMHGVIWLQYAVLGPPSAAYPGFARFDAILGLPSLPLGLVRVAGGGLLVAAGLALIVAANLALRKFGSGAAAFVLTQRMIQHGVYGRTRNPMSLGLYLASMGLGLCVASTYVTLGVMVAVIRSHMFFLRCFEERELERRFGPGYLAYRKRVPFLLPSFRGHGKRL